jgi:hypothetical protein
MRLVVKHEGSVVQEFRFGKGPVYIGRHNQNQIVLTNRSVSRQHAVLYTTADGHTLIEDLHSGNGTSLNGRPVDKAQVKSGDAIGIADYTLEIELDESPAAAGTSHLDDTLIAAPREAQVIARKLAADHGPDLVMPVHRAKDLAKAASAICQANGPDETAGVLVDILIEQFRAKAAWCGLRGGFEGPWTSRMGKTREGQDMSPHDLELQTCMDRATQTSQFLLLPHGLSDKSVRSAMIAPIVGGAGSLGCLVVENGADQEPYHLRDLDYLMLLAIHAGAVLENF